ncbi:MAG: BatA domain-containing protein [Gemmatimonadota bacterium]|nr:MAG: BatA domain-containing protein [Gemmatimonadota bacterium]
MGISLLAPLFLAGLAALAIPVIIHLTQKTKKEAIPFPSLMFLRRVPYKTARRQRIRHWLLFLLRSSAIVILVVAFARPLLENAAVGGIGLETAREVVLMVDRSYSMGYGDRWSRALDAAHGVIDGLGPEDRATLVLFSDHATAVSDAMGDGAALRAALDAAELSNGTTRYATPLQLAEQILAESQLPNREAILVTDFQKVGWQQEAEIQLPTGTELQLIDVAEPDPANIAVTNLTLDRIYRDGRELVAVLARVANQGEDSLKNAQIGLLLDGDQVGSQGVSVDANGSATVRFPSFAMPRREVRGSVQLAADALPLDNVFRFVLSPGQSISVLILEHANAGRDESLYLHRALSIGSEPPHTVTVKPISALRPSDLDANSVVILNDAPFPTGTSGTRLRRFLNDGGGVMAVLGPRSGPSSWPQDAADLLPGAIGVPVDRLGDRGGTLSIMDYKHPVFDVFSAPRSGDFSQARYFRYRRIQDEGRSAVLARFDDGNIALAETRVGRGKMLVWASGLSNSWNDLPLQPVFLPTLHQVVRHLARYAPRESWFIAGQVLDLSQYLAQGVVDGTVSVLGTGVDIIIESPAGEREVRQIGSTTEYLTLAEQGFYEIRHAGDNDVVGAIAVNLDVTESNLSRLDAEELASSVTYRGAGQAAADLAATLTPTEKERRQALWWYLLISVLAILVAESAISNRVSRRNP